MKLLWLILLQYSAKRSLESMTNISLLISPTPELAIFSYLANTLVSRKPPFSISLSHVPVLIILLLRCRFPNSHSSNKSFIQSPSIGFKYSPSSTLVVLIIFSKYHISTFNNYLQVLFSIFYLLSNTVKKILLMCNG